MKARLLFSGVLPIVVSVAALMVTLQLPSVGAYFFLFVPAVMTASWYGGRTGCVVSTLTSVLLIEWFMITPGRSHWLVTPDDLLLLMLFGGVCAAIGLVTAGHRRGLVERERALREAEAARQSAEISGRLKDQFLATLSHELRTPLNAVLGWTRMLATQQVAAEKIPAALASIERNAQAQKQLVDDLLDVSAIVSGRLRLTAEVVHLEEVVREAIDAVKLSLDSRQQHLDQQLDAVRIVGDADRLRQVVWNLLSNAVKFSPDGGAIAVRLERTGAFARLTVRDSGRGIRPEFLPHVFEPFRQADASITRTSGGLGLGLALVQHIVEAHGGTVTASSEGVTHGSEFTVTLPVQGVPADATVPAFDQPRATRVTQAAAPDGDTPPPRDTLPAAAPHAAAERPTQIETSGVPAVTAGEPPDGAAPAANTP